jgi:hypothetical protein
VSRPNHSCLLLCRVPRSIALSTTSKHTKQTHHQANTLPALAPPSSTFFCGCAGARYWEQCGGGVLRWQLLCGMWGWQQASYRCCCCSSCYYSLLSCPVPAAACCLFPVVNRASCMVCIVHRTRTR